MLPYLISFCKGRVNVLQKEAIGLRNNARQIRRQTPAGVLNGSAFSVSSLCGRLGGRLIDRLGDALEVPHIVL